MMRHLSKSLFLVLILFLGYGGYARGTTAGQRESTTRESTNASADSSATANVDKNSGQLSDGTKIDATLANSVDAKKNKPGDRVEARTAQDVKQDGKVVMKKGTRMVGHVTQMQQRTGDKSQSQMGILFDRAILANGQEVPLNATIQALAMAESSMNTAAAMGSDDVMASDHAAGMGRAGGGLAGGVGSAAGGVGSTASGVGSSVGGTAAGAANTTGRIPANAGGTLNSATHSTGSVGGLTPTGRLAPNSTGVFGLEGLSIDAAGSNATNGSLIISSTKNVHLDSGTQMLLSVGRAAQ